MDKQRWHVGQAVREGARAAVAGKITEIFMRTTRHGEANVERRAAESTWGIERSLLRRTADGFAVVLHLQRTSSLEKTRTVEENTARTTRRPHSHLRLHHNTQADGGVILAFFGVILLLAGIVDFYVPGGPILFVIGLAMVVGGVWGEISGGGGDGGGEGHSRWGPNGPPGNGAY